MSVSHSQGTFDVMILTALALLFMFAVLFLVTNGKIMESLSDYAHEFALFLTAIWNGLPH